MRTAMLTLVAALLLAAPSHVGAATGSQQIIDSTFDAVLLRPLSGFATIVGSVLFVPTALMAAPSGRTGLNEAWDVFVKSPYDSMVERPLGEF